MFRGDGFRKLAIPWTQQSPGGPSNKQDMVSVNWRWLEALLDIFRKSLAPLRSNHIGIDRPCNGSIYSKTTDSIGKIDDYNSLFIPIYNCFDIYLL